MSVVKILTSVFLDAHGILFIDYLEKGETTNSKYYIALLVHLKEEIAKKPQQMKKNVFFYQGNAPCHKSIETMEKQLLHHHISSPNLTPNDYYLFADLKRMSHERDLAPMKK